MRTAVVLVALFVATLLLALWAFGVFEAASPTDSGTRPGDPSTAPGGLHVSEPRDEPSADPVTIPVAVRVLAIGSARRSFTDWLRHMWEKSGGFTYQTWFSESGERSRSPSLEDLAAPPTPDLLSQVQVLVLDDMDPKALPDAFWSRVRERVRSGSLGLLFCPGVKHGHALATHPSLAELMPVTPDRVAPLQVGSATLAGVFPEERPVRLTEEGKTHPLTRLVRWPRWSVTKWERLASGPKAWGTMFVHPVREKDARAVTLLTVRGHRSEDMPALVASDPAKGRVLWVGVVDFGQGAYRDAGRSDDAMRALSLSWLAWLAGATA